MSSVLIIGDSFAAKHPGDPGFATWYDLLGNNHSVVNRAQAGVGQYKINQQYQPTADICILLITSELRLHCVQNPFYPAHDHRHHCSDLIYNDIRDRLPDVRAQHIDYYFDALFDVDHARYMHNLLLRDIESRIQQRLIPVTFFSPFAGQHDFHGRLRDLSWIFDKHRGDVNHLTAHGHQLVHQQLMDLI